MAYGRRKNSAGRHHGYGWLYRVAKTVGKKKKEEEEDVCIVSGSLTPPGDQMSAMAGDGGRWNSGGIADAVFGGLWRARQPSDDGQGVTAVLANLPSATNGRLLAILGIALNSRRFIAISQAALASLCGFCTSCS